MASHDDIERTPVAPVVVPRWVQMVLLPLAVLAAYALLRAAGPVALLFIVARPSARLLRPCVTLVRRARFPRGLAGRSVALSVILVVTGSGVRLARPVAGQVSAVQCTG